MHAVETSAALPDIQTPARGTVNFCSQRLQTDRHPVTVQLGANAAAKPIPRSSIITTSAQLPPTLLISLASHPTPQLPTIEAAPVLVPDNYTTDAGL